MMDRIAVKEDPELSRRVPGQLPCRIEIVTRRGERKTAATDYPLGHYRNPMSDADIEDKFRIYARRVLPESSVDRALTALWTVDAAPSLDAVFDSLVRP
jgi:2-methylcitrate dehydratase